MPSTNKSAKIKECVIERRLVAGIKRLGGLCIKLDASTCIGIPDRLVVCNGVTALVELKRPRGGRISGAQKMLHKMLAVNGQPVYILSTTEAVDLFLIEVENGTYRTRIRND